MFPTRRPGILLCCKMRSKPSCIEKVGTILCEGPARTVTPAAVRPAAGDMTDGSSYLAEAGVVAIVPRSGLIVPRSPQ